MINEEIIKKCKHHGNLNISQVYVNKDVKLKKGFCYKCKLCCYDAAHKRPCKKHGELRDDQRCPSGRCKVCSLEKLLKINKNRNENREDFNAKQKLKRDANPEKYALDYKIRYQLGLKKHGNEYLNDKAKANKFNITIEEYDCLFKNHNNKCAICKQPETRIFKNSRTGELKVMKLCIDHCHKSGKVRGLLCHDCNTALGKFKDSIDNLQSSIDYLKKHQ